MFWIRISDEIFWRQQKGGKAFLFLLLWIREEGGEIRRHALNINWTFFNFHPFYLLKLEGKTMWKSENIAMLTSIRDIIFYVRSKTAWYTWRRKKNYSFGTLSIFLYYLVTWKGFTETHIFGQTLLWMLCLGPIYSKGKYMLVCKLLAITKIYDFVLKTTHLKKSNMKQENVALALLLFHKTRSPFEYICRNKIETLGQTFKRKRLSFSP